MIRTVPADGDFETTVSLKSILAALPPEAAVSKKWIEAEMNVTVENDLTLTNYENHPDLCLDSDIDTTIYYSIDDEGRSATRDDPPEDPEFSVEDVDLGVEILNVTNEQLVAAFDLNYDEKLFGSACDAAGL